MSSMCFTAFQKAIKSPIGAAIEHIFANEESPPPDDVNILLCQNNLKQNLYKSPEEWFAAVTAISNNAIRHYGEKSEIGLAISTIYLMIGDNCRFMNSSDSEKYSGALSTLTDSLRAFADQAPDNSDSFQVFSAVPENPADPDLRADPCAYTAAAASVDKLELKAMVQSLRTDEEMRHVADLISRFEPNFGPAKGIVDYDLEKCSPYTLQRIHSYVRGRVAPPPPRPVQSPINPAMIPRMKSTPIPPSILNSAMQPIKIKTPDGESKMVILSAAAKNQLVMKMMTSAASLAVTSPFLASPTIQKTPGGPTMRLTVDKQTAQFVKEQLQMSRSVNK